jgi:D-lactate dehydrogenase
MKIGFFSTQDFEPPYFTSRQLGYELCFFKESLNTNSVNMAKGLDAVCVFVNDKLDAHCLNSLAHLKLKCIALRCTGVNNVDLDAAKKYQIPVVNVPRYSPYAVAEHALALILCLNRKIHKAYNRVREGNFSINGLQGFDLHNKTLGIIGLGAIGQVLAQIGIGLGMNILAYDPYVKTQAAVKLVDLSMLCQNSDVISLHCPLTPATLHIIGDQEIAMMKRGGILINTGRGALINAKALIRGLKSKKLAGVGLDVYEQESGLFFLDHSNDIIQDDVLMRLTTFPNVIITSHQAYLTQEALTEIARVTMHNIDLVFNGKFCPNLM